MSETAPIMSVQNVTKRFPGVLALNNVSFDLAPGEVHALCGENGAGKSTLIKVLSGVWPNRSYDGSVILNGAETTFSGIHDSENAGIAVIYQELALVPDMTVGENIFLGREPTKGGVIDWNRVYSEAECLLAQYGLDLDPASTVSDLGVGQQQLVEIVKALSKKSKILLLDEPTAALTETEVDILLNIIRDIRRKGVTCVYISHKLDEVFSISDRITVLRDGESIITLNTKETDANEVIKYMVGREIKAFFPRKRTKTGDVLLKVEGLTVNASGRSGSVLEDISFELRAGEVLGIGGLMGAGRTELLMHLFGAFGERKAGVVLLNGSAFNSRSPAESISKGLMIVSEDRKRYGLNLDKSIGFNFSLASLASVTDRMLINSSREFASNQKMFDSLGVKAPSQEETVGNLSGGNQQKVVLGKALLTEPSVIFLDEPTRGIDVGAKVDVYELMNKLTELGKAVVMVSSEMPELMGMSDRMIILSEGRIGGEFSSGTATQAELLASAMANHSEVKK